MCWDLSRCSAGLLWSRRRLAPRPGGLLPPQTHLAGQQSHQRGRYDRWERKSSRENAWLHHGGETWLFIFYSRLMQKKHYFWLTLINYVILPSSVKELETQRATLEFEISLKAVSVLRYITDHTGRYGSGCGLYSLLILHWFVVSQKKFICNAFKSPLWHTSCHCSKLPF